MNSRTILIGCSAIIATALLTAYLTSSMAKDNSVSLTYHTAVCPVVTRADGTVELLPCGHNLVTNDGKDALKTCLAGAACGVPTAFNNISLANCSQGGTVAATDHYLCYGQEWNNKTNACGLTSVAGTYRNYDQGAGAVTGAWNVTYEWTSTCDTVYVNGTGLYNNTLLLAENAFTSTVTLMTGDKLNVTWGVWIS